MSKKKIPIMLEAALEYLSEGYSVIPLKKDKTPLIKWKKYQEELPSVAEVTKWFSHPDVQIGIVTGWISRIVVIDIEAGGDPSHYPETMTAKTGGGGWHFYYSHPGFPIDNRTKFIDLADIRGDGGYVVAPPSVSEKGPYKWLNRLSRSELPLFPVDVIETLWEKHKKKDPSLITVGERNNAAAKIIGEMLSRGMSHQFIRDELHHWNQTELEEPLSEVELAKVFSSITSRHENKVDSEEFVLEPFTLTDLYQKNFPETQWVAKDLLPLGCMAAITGESSTYKSFLALALAEAVVTGKPFLGHFVTTQAKGRVLIIDEENSQQNISNRYKNMGVPSRDDIFFVSRKNVQVDNPKHLQAVINCIEEIQPTLIILDSLVRFHNKDENSASEMKIVMQNIRKLVGDGRTVVFIHHHKKEQGFGGSANNSIRGSTDIFNALDCHIGVRRKTNEVVVSQRKLRAQVELEPFTVLIEKLEDQKLRFTYKGVDTSRDDAIAGIAKEVLQILSDSETVTRKELVEQVNAGTKLIDEALGRLHEEKLIERKKGHRNSYIFSLPKEVEEDTNDNQTSHEEN